MTASINIQSEKASILLIYTGGTIGMKTDPATGVLVPFDFRGIYDEFPAIRSLQVRIDVQSLTPVIDSSNVTAAFCGDISDIQAAFEKITDADKLSVLSNQIEEYAVSTIQFDPAMDSSEMGPESWMKIVKIIADNYQLYDGFVVLHGTDTMSFTASALSFMLENLSKPVIFTGSQLPIGMLRTDGKENLITAIEIAAAKENGVPVVPEVCIFFENDLLRGNRTSKINADNFNAFRSYNYPPLAHAGIYIKYDTGQVYHPVSRKPLKPHYLLDRNIAVLKLFPGISPQVVESILNIPGLKGVVMETFGSGNAPCYDWFLTMLKEAVSRGIVIVNVTQCSAGSVEMHRYETGHKLLEAGVISGFDSTTESAVTKLMFLFGHGLTPEEVKDHMNCSLIGEVTIPDSFRP